ncbi:glycosyltransferase family 4 protein [Pseudarthrobacter sp. 1G09]|uniref:glycosyltransferase family 4 protein n=1 Tax=Pseudarthrobacter sp. 1G09 TaxID=3416178 RepID=UPI003CEDFD60
MTLISKKIPSAAARWIARSEGSDATIFVFTFEAKPIFGRTQLKILRVVTLASATGKYGGPFDTAISQARLIANIDGQDVTLLAGHMRNDRPAIIGAKFEFVGRDVYRVLARTGFFTCFSWKMLAEIFRQVRRVDIVHVSYAREFIPLMTSALAIMFRKPLVLQPHGMLTTRTSAVHKVVDLLAAPMFRKAKRVIALTGVERTQLEGWAHCNGENWIDVIGNPLPYVPSSETGSPRSHKAVFIARLEPRKRVSDFVEARRIAHDNGWNEVYEVVGPDQGDGAAVQSAAESLPGLIYGGAIPSSSIEAVLGSAGVFVLTSDNEPWGNVLVAALATDLPVVVTQSAALADEVDRNRLGLVVPDRDPRAVAEAVHRILGSNWRTAEEARAARDFARKRFDQVEIRQKLLSTYIAASEGRV